MPRVRVRTPNFLRAKSARTLCPGDDGICHYPGFLRPCFQDLLDVVQVLLEFHTPSPWAGEVVPVVLEQGFLQVPIAHSASAQALLNVLSEWFSAKFHSENQLQNRVHPSGNFTTPFRLDRLDKLVFGNT